MSQNVDNHHFKKSQLTWLVILRVAIGWHFLYEGLVKLLNPNWSPLGYLLDSKGVFAPFYKMLASGPVILSIVDHLNQWGLILIGIGLILGYLTKLSAYSGMVLLAFYYLSHPPFIGLNYALPNEGSYLIIDKVLIEFFALGVLTAFSTGRYYGLDSLIFKRKNKYGDK